MNTDKAPLGERRRHEILAGVVNEGDAAEGYHLEVKSTVDLKTGLGLAKVTKFIIGAANRDPDRARRWFDGYAVMVLGAAHGETKGIPAGTEAHDLANQLRKYLGPSGPTYDLERLPGSEPNNEVLFIIVDPPEAGDRIFCCHKEWTPADRAEKKHALADGAIYVRHATSTSLAKGDDVDRLNERAQATPKASTIELEVEVVGRAVMIDDLAGYFRTLEHTWAEAYKKDQADRRDLAGRSPSLEKILKPAWVQQQSAPRTPVQVERDLEDWEERLPAHRSDNVDFLAGAALEGIGFRITSTTGYAPKPRLDLRFHGCRGVEWLEPTLDEAKLLPPVVERRANPPASQFAPMPQLHVANYPVSWENEADDLLVTLTPAELRPGTTWRSETDDLAVIVSPGATADHPGEVRVSWVATFEGRDERLDGTISVPVSARDALQLLWRLQDATKAQAEK